MSDINSPEGSGQIDQSANKPVIKKPSLKLHQLIAKMQILLTPHHKLQEIAGQHETAERNIDTTSETRELSKQELFNQAKEDFSRRLPNQFTDDEMSNFIQEHVTGVRKNGVNVILVSQDYAQQQGKMNPILRAYIGDPKTKAVGIEYFIPELKKYNTPGMNIMPERNDFAKNMEDACREERKTVIVTDIANKLGYVSNLIGLQLALLATPLGWAPALLNAALNAQDKGVIGKERHPLEKMVLDAEDARRVYIATGLLQVTEEFKPSDKQLLADGEKQLPQIIVSYPTAHTNRILNYMLNPSLVDKLSIQVKRFLYRVMPGLDFRVRQYEWKDTLARASGNTDAAGWMKVSDNPISPFKKDS